MIDPDELLVGDRYYGLDYQWLIELLAKGQWFIFRIRNDADVTVAEEFALTDEDRDARDRVQQWMEMHPRVKTLHIFYPEVLHHPLEQAVAVNEFLGIDLDVEAMASAVDTSMWHQKSK